MCCLSGAGRALQGASSPTAFLGQVTIVRWGIRIRRALPFRKHFWTLSWGRGFCWSYVATRRTRQTSASWPAASYTDFTSPGWSPGKQDPTEGRGGASGTIRSHCSWIPRCSVSWILALSFSCVQPSLSGWKGTPFLQRPSFKWQRGTKDLYLRSPLARLPVTRTPG